MLGVTNVLKKIFGDKSEKDVKALQPIVAEINHNFQKLSSISNDELRAKTLDFKSRIQEHIKEEQDRINKLKKETEENIELSFEEKDALYQEVDKLEEKTDEKIEQILQKILPEAFAVVKETARRFKENDSIEVTASAYDKELADQKDNVEIKGDKAIWYSSWEAAGNEIVWDMVHYDVQLIGGIALHQGKIAEMQTGEGKTLVSTLPVYLNALAGRGVHLVTVNDYLARRDAEWMGPLHQFHGLTVDCIDNHKPNSDTRREAYLSDITYGTNNEFGFDYLRDNMATDPNGLVQRKKHYAIVDEVDSVLIDDARTPLIISGPTPKGDQHQFDGLRPKVEKLFNAQRSLINNLLAEAKRHLKDFEEADLSKDQLKEGGLALFRCYRGLPKNKALIKYLSESGIKAHMLKTEAYYLQDRSKEMPEADKVLYFVIDEKNNSIEMTEKGLDLITGDNEDPNLFIMPDVGAKIVEIESSGKSHQEQVKDKDQLMRDYSSKAERIHTINQLLKAYTMFEKDVDYILDGGKVKIVDEQTGRVMEGRRYSDGLHQAIESKEKVKIEASTQTYATVTLQNFFRMYHKLSGMTGTAETEAGEFWDIYELDVMVIPTNRPITRFDLEDKVYKTAREKYNAVIEDVEALRDEGRPVLIGTTTVEISELLSRMLKMRGIKHQVLNAKLHQKEADVVAEAGKPGTVTIATNMAGRGTDIKLGEGVKEAGGLAIIGTERHDSRRVDRQLRGRAGRQGDPGSSSFYVSLEDNLMRLFGSDRIARVMDRLGLEEGEVIQHSMITKSIERAQKKVEENNFGIRKRLLEYDDVMNAQREVIYKRRRHALFGERLNLDITNMFYNVCENTVIEAVDMKDYEGLKMELIRTLSIDCPVTEEEFSSINEDELIQKVFDAAYSNYQNKAALIAEQAMPVIKNVFENESDQYQNIVVPFTDGRRTLNVVANLQKAYDTNGAMLGEEIEKGVTLGLIDNEWKEHLREMDDLRQSVQNAVHEQKDPLLVYKFESYELFKKMVAKIDADIVSFLVKATLPGGADAQVSQAPQQQQNQKLQASRTEIPQYAGGNQSSTNGQQGQPQQPQKKVPVQVGKKIGRNDKVKIVNLSTGESKELKFKQAEPLISSGQWQMMN